MKKIDLHIHTKSTISDSDFDFSTDKLREYIVELKIDAIAITNHNYFDKEQFQKILEELNDLEVLILPGIEIDLEGGHLLLISENKNLDDFSDRVQKIEDKIQTKTDYITLTEFKEIFESLDEYLLIPHYDKDPKIKEETLSSLDKDIFCGEVSSQKKFIYAKKDEHSLPPVIFSDLRFSDNISDFSVRQTFIKTDNLSFSSIKLCLMDKSKVFISQKGVDDLFQVLSNGLEISNNLTLVLGKRSTGKTTHVLDKIYNNFDNVKYIKQFELLEKDDKKNEKEFNKKLEKERSKIAEEYLKEFKDIVDDVGEISILEEKKKIEYFIESLLTVGSEAEIIDAYSNSVLYTETKYDVLDNKKLETIIKSVIELIENNDVDSIVEQYISKTELKRMLVDLINEYNKREEYGLKKKFVNSIIENIQKGLKSHTANASLADVSFSDYLMAREKIKKFNLIVKNIQQEHIEEIGDVGKFKSIVEFKKYINATTIGDRIGKKISFVEAYKKYNTPFEYLQKIKETSLNNSEYYKCFVNIKYKILNEFGLEVSGGERSEFNLLEKITDALNYDILLIDEPESSFDNIFLKDDINQKIKELSEKMPVIISTHNSTVGALIQPNYVLYTKRDIINNKPIFDIFSGSLTGGVLKSLKTDKEEKIKDIFLTCLEAGENAYKNKQQIYENIGN
jgi:ABC-type phosphate transport system ATPase subunit